MKPRTTLVLLGLAVALAGFIFGLDRCSQNTRDRRERAAHVIEVNRTAIEGFTIHNGDGLVKIKADGDAWKMVAPWQDDADAAVVDQLLDARQNVRDRRDLRLKTPNRLVQAALRRCSRTLPHRRALRSARSS